MKLRVGISLLLWQIHVNIAHINFWHTIDDADDDEEIAYFTMRWKTRDLVKSIAGMYHALITLSKHFIWIADGQ